MFLLHSNYSLILIFSDLQLTKDYYAAMITFNKLCYEQENLVKYRLRAGDCVVFDNLRVLHGREGFQVGPGDSRYLAGCYVDWDEIHDKINVLQGQTLL